MTVYSREGKMKLFHLLLPPSIPKNHYRFCKGEKKVYIKIYMRPRYMLKGKLSTHKVVLLYFLSLVI